MALLACPDCARQMSDAAPACPGCGRPNSAVSSSAPLTLEGSGAGPVLRILGALLLLGGGGGVAYFYAFFDTSVATETLSFMGQTFGGLRVNNLGLMQDRQLGLVMSALAVVLGLVLLLYARSRSE